MKLDLAIPASLLDLAWRWRDPHVVELPAEPAATLAGWTGAAAVECTATDAAGWPLYLATTATAVWALYDCAPFRAFAVVDGVGPEQRAAVAAVLRAATLALRAAEPVALAELIEVTSM